MSDNWKMLLNQFGIPGPAEPPASEEAAPEPAEPKAATPGFAKEVPGFVKEVPSVAKEMPSLPKAASSIARETPAQPKPPASFSRSAPPAAAEAPRRRSSMWGDETEEEPSAPVTPPAIRQAAAPATDPLREMAEVRRTDPTVPGFDVPQSSSPEPPKAPVKRSAWDTLIGSLGIKTTNAPDPEPAPPAAAAPPWKSRPAAAAETLPSETPSRERQPSTGRSEAGRSERAAADERPPRESNTPRSGGFGAGLVDSDERSESSSRPRQRRGGPTDAREPAAERRSFDAPRGGRPEPTREPVAEFEDRDFVPPISSRETELGTNSGADFREPADDQEMPSRRRSRRRGQRQLISGENLEPVAESGEIGSTADSPAREPSERRAPRRDSTEERGPRREASPTRERRERPARETSGREVSGREPLSGRESSGRPHPIESGERAASRSTRRPPRQEEPRGGEFLEVTGDTPDDDLLLGFGEGLLDEVADVAAPGEEDRAARPRRRRGRRGRGRGGRSEEATTADPEAPVADAFLAPEFDDDLEDDDEAERIRHRSRGSRPEGGRAAGPRPDAGRPEAAAEPRRPSRPAADRPDRPDRDIPTWIDTVSLLVNANINRRSTGGNSGGPRGQGGGRERRR